MARLTLVRKPPAPAVSSRLEAPAPPRAEIPQARTVVPRPEREAAFVAAMSPHLRSAYGLARWLCGNDADGEDATQDAYIRALRHFESWNGQHARAWLLAIVRRCCYTLLRARGDAGAYDDELHAEEAVGSPVHAELEGPERAALRADDARLLNQAVAALPVEQREVLVLRELEGLSYREIAEVAGIPIGTVMSRLSRARAQLQQTLRAPGERR